MSEENSNFDPDQLHHIKSRLAEGEDDFDLMDFMDLVVTEVKRLTLATGVVIELVDGDELVCQAATGVVKDYIGFRLPIDSSFAGLCIRSRQVLYSDDTEQDPRVNVEACRKVGARSILVAPLFNDGKAVGTLKVISEHTHAFSEKDVKILQTMAVFIASGLARQLFQEFRDFF